MIHALTAAALAGLMGSPHCVGMCGPFALACGERAGHHAAWHAGRLLTYALLGAAAGAAGAHVPGPPWVATLVSGTLVVWFAAALAGLAPEPRVRIPGLGRLAARAARRDDPASRFLFGMANGLLPCGLVYAALGMAVATGSALGGVAVMAAFGAATVPALAAFGLGVRRLAAPRPWLRGALAALVLVSGLWAVVQRHDMPAVGGGAAHAAPPATHSSSLP